MKLLRFISSRIKVRCAASERARLRKSFSGETDEMIRGQWHESLANPTDFYLKCCHYYDWNLIKEIRRHREYFCENGRGFGEDAFHVMWFLLFQEFRPESFLEIGVFRGQTLSLAALLARHFKLNCFVQGISPFTSAGDAVSKYRRDVDYYEDTLKNFEHFGLPRPHLIKAFSTDVAARDMISSWQWSLIYIDGNHDYEVARQDWELCATNLRAGGVIVLDDAGLDTAYVPPIFATAGHPGPSRLAREIDKTFFAEILQVGHNRVFQKIK